MQLAAGKAQRQAMESASRSNDAAVTCKVVRKVWSSDRLLANQPYSPTSHAGSGVALHNGARTNILLCRQDVALPILLPRGIAVRR